MNLHHKVEMAFDNLQEALSCAADNAESRDEIMLYSDLADECIGLRDKAHRDLTDLIIKNVIKKAAPAVGATEAAKNDSDKESISSVAENGENVKPRAHFKVNIYPDSHVECSFDADTDADGLALYKHVSEMLLELFKTIKANSVLGGAK